MNPIKLILSHNKKNNLKFDEKNHKYTILDDIKLESVTTKLKKFFPFDAVKIAKRLAELRGIHHNDILDEWERIRDNGSYIHLLAEKICNGNKLSTVEQNKVKHVMQFIKDHPHFEILGSELRVFSKKYKVAGTIDLVLLNKENNKLYFLDWKTSIKDIVKNDYWEMAKGKLKELPANKYHKYFLQVAIYMFIAKLEYGIEIYDSMLIHLREDLTYKILEPIDLLLFAEDVLMSDSI